MLAYGQLDSCILLNENVWIMIKNSLKFVPKVRINHIPALVQIMAWRCPGDKPLSGPMMVRLPTQICVTRPQWVNNWTNSIKKIMKICIAVWCFEWKQFRTFQEGIYPLLAFRGTTILMSYFEFYRCAHKFHLWVPDYNMGWRDLTT